MIQELVFKELTTGREILESLRLRYDVCMNSRLREFTRGHEEKRAIYVPHDLSARHFGVVVRVGSGERIVAANRVVGESFCVPKDVREHLEVHCGSLAPRKAGTRFHLPFEQYITREAARGVRAALPRQGRLVEASGFVADANVGRTTVAVGTIECLVAVFRLSSGDTGCTAVARSSRRAYERAGFRAATNCPEFVVPGGTRGILLVNDAPLEPECQRRLERLCDEWSQNQEVRIEAHRPDERLQPPTEKGGGKSSQILRLDARAGSPAPA